MKISSILLVAATAAAVSIDTTSQIESAQQSLIIGQPGVDIDTDTKIHNIADGSLHHSQSSDRWLGTLVGLKTSTEDVSGATRVTLRPRLKARNEGALGQAPWYGMAVGLACTTLMALMLG